MKLFGRQLHKNDWWRASLVIPVALAAWLFAGTVMPNHALLLEKTIAGCLPWNLYWWDKTRPGGMPERYALVVFPARNIIPVLPDGSRIGKMVAGLPGDVVRISGGDVYINDVFIGDVRYGAQKLRRPAGYWDQSYILGKDEIFVYGSEENSWDSRYWGPYPLRLLAGRIAVVF